METVKIDIEEEIENKQKQFVDMFMLSTIIIHIFYGILFYKIDFKIVTYINVTLVVFTIYSKFFISNLNFNFKFLLNLGLYSYASFFYLLQLIFWDSFPLAYLWLVSIPIAVLLIKPFKIASYWTISVIVLALSAPFVSSFIFRLFNINLDIHFSNSINLIINSSVFIFSIFMLLLMLYFYNAFNRLKIKQVENIPFQDEGKSVITQKVNVVMDEKFISIFHEIEKFIETSRPYQQPEYNINDLANDLSSNSTYIAKALKQGVDLSFNNYLNSCRIKEIKKRIINREHEQFTLKHLYTEAGFTQQSTFNRVFKVVEGVTPSEFINSLKTTK